MSVAEHLEIRLSEYDRRIRTFIPGYAEMLRTTADALERIRTPQPLVVDLGIGTGALARRCLEVAPRARIIGIDADPDILAVAKRRLARTIGTPRTRGGVSRHSFLQGDFLQTPLPRCHAIVATLALHHVRSAPTKRRFYARCFRALKRGGVLASGDAFLAGAPARDRQYMDAWRAHMRRSYSARETSAFLAAWARDDTYFPLSVELQWLAAAGFVADVAWRRPPFAVLVGLKPGP